MKKSILQIFAIAIGLLAVITAFHFLGKSRLAETGQTANGPLQLIGEITEAQGQVERRLAGSVRFESVPGPRTIFSQDLLLTQEGSHADLKLQEGSGTDTGLIELRLNEGSKFIVEYDASHPGALIGTLLGGTVTLLKPGKPGLFRLFREGREIPITSSESPSVPILPDASSARPKISATPSMGLVITATQANETSAPRAVSVAAKPDTAESSEVLSNDDIVRQLRRQSGFFQRCYLNYLHRIEAKNDALSEGGTVTVSFTIQANGKVSDVQTVKSDFKDSTLHNCLSEVVERTIFRGFHGTPIPVLEFPISLR